MRLLLAVFVVTLLAYTGCQPVTYDSWRNEQIDPEIQKVIERSSHQLIRLMAAGDRQALVSMMSPNLQEKSQASLDTLVELYSQIASDTPFSFMERVHFKNTGITTVTIPVADKEKPFRLSLPANTRSGFFTSMILKSGYVEHMVAATFNEIQGEWKLVSLYAGVYSALGNGPVDYLEESKTEMRNGHLMDAALKVLVATELLRPAGTMLTYDRHKELEQYRNTLLASVKEYYPMPMTMQLPGDPVLMDIQPYLLDDELVPLINYMTSIPLHDTVALKNEYERIHDIVAYNLPGLAEGKNRLLYCAYHNVQDDPDNPENVVFIKNLSGSNGQPGMFRD